jgi:hypothetical protein
MVKFIESWVYLCKTTTVTFLDIVGRATDSNSLVAEENAARVSEWKGKGKRKGKGKGKGR